MLFSNCKSLQPHCSECGKLTSWLSVCVRSGSYLFPEVYVPMKLLLLNTCGPNVNVIKALFHSEVIPNESIHTLKCVICGF